MKNRAARAPSTKTSDREGRAGLYTLEVFLIGGPVNGEFTRRNRIISRTIQILGDQTLEDLHEAIFFAFDRMDAHMYEFQIGGRGPMDPKARRYGVPTSRPRASLRGQEPVTDARRVTIESLGLGVHDRFGYWFDFGDNWWHQINVVAIHRKAPAASLPRVVKRVGENPPQYGDQNEEE